MHLLEHGKDRASFFRHMRKRQLLFSIPDRFHGCLPPSRMQNGRQSYTTAPKNGQDHTGNHRPMSNLIIFKERLRIMAEAIKVLVHAVQLIAVFPKYALAGAALYPFQY